MHCDVLSWRASQELCKLINWWKNHLLLGWITFLFFQLINIWFILLYNQNIEHPYPFFNYCSYWLVSSWKDLVESSTTSSSLSMSKFDSCFIFKRSFLFIYSIFFISSPNFSFSLFKISHYFNFSSVSFLCSSISLFKSLMSYSPCCTA